jgi:hypothetical protein
VNNELPTSLKSKASEISNLTKAERAGESALHEHRLHLGQLLSDAYAEIGDRRDGTKKAFLAACGLIDRTALNYIDYLRASVEVPKLFRDADSNPRYPTYREVAMALAKPRNYRQDPDAELKSLLRRLVAAPKILANRGTSAALKVDLRCACANLAHTIEALGECKREPPDVSKAVRFTEATVNEKLVPTTKEEHWGRSRPVSAGALMDLLELSLDTCDPGCPAKGDGCYAEQNPSVIRQTNAGYGIPDMVVHVFAVRVMTAALVHHGVAKDGGRSGDEGRDLRLFGSGDVRTDEDAKRYAVYNQDRRNAGGGVTFGYTHSWHYIFRQSFGGIVMLASIHSAEEIAEAQQRGYAPFLLWAADAFPNGDKAFKLPGSDATFVPCLEQTRKIPCVQCRLCLDDQKLLKENRVPVVLLHGQIVSASRLKRFDAARAPDGEIKPVLRADRLLPPRRGDLESIASPLKNSGYSKTEATKAALEVLRLLPDASFDDQLKAALRIALRNAPRRRSQGRR